MSFRRSFAAALAAVAAATCVWSGVIAGSAVAGIGPAASAQDTGNGSQRRGARFAKMLMDIRPPLTDAQKAQIRKMRDDMRAQYRNQPMPTDPAQRRARFQAFMERIRGVLNPAQQRDFDAKMAAMRARQQQGQH